MGGKLSKLNDSLGPNQFTVYRQNSIYVALVNNIPTEMQAQEVLEVGRINPDEKVAIGYFGEDIPTRVSYMGEDAEASRQTLDDLRLPNGYPSNLGEQILFIFRGEIKNSKGQFHFEKEVMSGFEHELDFGLRKLIHVYDNKKIDDLFYAHIKQQRKAHS